MQNVFSNNIIRYKNLLLGPPNSCVKAVELGYGPVIYFLATLFLYSIYLCLTQPDWILGGQMWAEMATNYFPVARDGSLIERLFATDSGYIPLLPRLIALIGSTFGLPAIATPYFYTWVAMLLSAVMVGAFCLRPFRAIVPSDVLRFTCGLIVLLAADFETRTFINFTYFGIFLIAVITALSLSEQDVDVPKWCWLILLLMLSKPAVLTILPAMVVVSFVAKRRFRLITVAAMILCIIQLIQMAVSHQNGSFAPHSTYTTFEKIDAGLRYAWGFLGGMLLGKGMAPEYFRPLIFGAIISCIIAVTLCFRRRRSNSLLLIGLSLLVMNSLLNTFALSDQWNDSMDHLPGVPLYRHTIVSFFGAVLIVTGWICSVFSASPSWASRKTNWAAPIALLVWFGVSGWAQFAFSINKGPGALAFNNSQWKGMSSAIDSGGPVCVPIDPLGWQFIRECTNFTPQISWGMQFDYRLLPNNGSTVAVVLPSATQGRRILSSSVLMKPETLNTSIVQASLVFHLKSGPSVVFSGQSVLPPGGGLVMLSATQPVNADDVQSTQLIVPQPVQLAYLRNNGHLPAISWYGQ
jgi:hypothetical protein